MPYTVTRSELQRLRLYNQRLASRTRISPEALVAALGAVQAQEHDAALLAIRARVAGTTATRLQDVVERQRRLLQTWCLRGTLHLIASADVHWLLPLVAPHLLKNSRRRYRQLDLDERTLGAATDLIIMALAERGPQTRAELVAYLEAENISAEGQRTPYLLRRAALLGLICLGPQRDGKETYVLLDEWVGRAPAKEGTWEMLATRYLAGYGPVAVEDFARWSGAGIREARAAFAAQEDALVEVEAEGQTLWLLSEAAEYLLGDPELPELPPRLLPAYDPLLLGYHSREWLVEPAFARLIHPGGGFLYPTLVAGGKAAGTWKRGRHNGRLEIEITPFAALDKAQTAMLEEEAADLGRFYARDAVLVIEGERKASRRPC